jgi:hypothetical protein
MELVFFPPVREWAVLKPLAPLFVAGDEGATLPIDTELRSILEEVWLAAEVLEVMRIHALGFVMLVVVGTPLSLEVEDIEVEISDSGYQVVDQADFNVFHTVCEGAVFSILTASDVALR